MSDGAESQPPSPYSRLMNRAFADAAPLTCQIEITYRCNHLCTFCYNSPSGAREMTTEQIFDVLKKVADFGVLYVTLTGGEALCHKDFYKIGEEVRRLGMALRIYSNGYLMADKKVVRKIKALSPVEIEISLHGATPETHEALTKIKGSFAKTVKAVRESQRGGDQGQSEVPDHPAQPARAVRDQGAGPSLGRHIIFDAVITPKDDGNLDPLSLRPARRVPGEVLGRVVHPKLHDGQEAAARPTTAPDGSANCGTGRSGFTIDPYGNLLPCVAFRRKIANVLEIDDIEQRLAPLSGPQRGAGPVRRGQTANRFEAWRTGDSSPVSAWAWPRRRRAIRWRSTRRWRSTPRRYAQLSAAPDRRRFGQGPKIRLKRLNLCRISSCAGA